jgi:hypothetical protein|tara:strand:- start:130 stop:792 length:663 start_codon:yes stop_codon:yes gene_type:complete
MKHNSMKKIITILFTIICPLLALSQDTNTVAPIKRNSIYVEYAGQGLYPSVSFDRLYRTEKKMKTSFTGGLTLIPIPDYFVFSVPASYNILFGKRKSKLELGIGVTAMYLREGNIPASYGYKDNNGVYHYEQFVGHEHNFFAYFTSKIGYRYQNPTGGLFFRVTLTPHLAGISSYGGVRGKNGIKTNIDDSYTEYFSSVAFMGNTFLLGVGVSIGWTLKK